MFLVQCLTYQERLVFLDLLSLELRRIIFDLLFVFKIVHKLVVTDLLSCFVFSENSTRSHGVKFVVPFCNLESTRNSFVYRSIRYWNVLPVNVVTLHSFNQFRAALKSPSVLEILSIFLKGDYISN